MAVEVPKLIAANSRRRRLYTLLSRGFLEWWNEKRAWRNEPFSILNENVKAQLPIADLGLLIKIENLISGKIGDDEHRLVYPYFSEEPALTLSGARIGLYLLHSALPEFPLDNFRILDVLRGRSYSAADAPLTGRESEDIGREYREMRLQRDKLLKEYA